MKAQRRYRGRRKKEKKNKKKVRVCAEEGAESGGELIECAGDEIDAN